MSKTSRRELKEKYEATSEYIAWKKSDALLKETSEYKKLRDTPKSAILLEALPEYKEWEKALDLAQDTLEFYKWKVMER
jgi:hypothetical protein